MFKSLQDEAKAYVKAFANSDTRLMELNNKINRNELQTSPVIIYTRKSADGATSVDLFQPGDTKADNVNYLDAGKVDNNWYFVYGVSLRSVTGAVAVTNPTLAAAAYTVAEQALLNGSIELEAGSGNYIVARETANMLFSATIEEGYAGFFPLPSVKFIPPNTQLNGRIKTATACTQYEQVEVALWAIKFSPSQKV